MSGGFLADDEFNTSQEFPAASVLNAGQQQFFTRNSNIDSWTNGVWNQVFLGDNGAPDHRLRPARAPTSTQPSRAPRSPRRPPFLDEDARGNYQVFVPAVQHNSVGPDYANGPAAGRLDLNQTGSSSRSPPRRCGSSTTRWLAGRT